MHSADESLLQQAFGPSMATFSIKDLILRNPSECQPSPTDVPAAVADAGGPADLLDPGRPPTPRQMDGTASKPPKRRHEPAHVGDAGVLCAPTPVQDHSAARQQPAQPSASSPLVQMPALSVADALNDASAFSRFMLAAANPLNTFIRQGSGAGGCDSPLYAQEVRVGTSMENIMKAGFVPPFPCDSSLAGREFATISNRQCIIINIIRDQVVN